MRLLTEALHIAAGLIAAVVLAALAAWGMPLAAHDIWAVDAVAIAFIFGMGIKPLREARALDLADRGK